LAALLWPEATDTNARRGPSQALGNLRQALGDAREGSAAAARYLPVSRESTQMNRDREYALDVARFRELSADSACHSTQHLNVIRSRLPHACAFLRTDSLTVLLFRSARAVSQVGHKAVRPPWAALLRQTRQMALLVGRQT
jgi:hypothetical protein